MRQLPPLNALRAFEAAARSHSFSAAAQELCVTHSAVSHQIRLLEDWLGQPVFRRHASGIALTPAGTSLQQAAGQALGLLEARCNEIRQSTQAQEIVLGAPGSFLANWLIPRLEAFETAHPAIRLRLQTSTDLAELASGRVDALIVSGRAPWPSALQTTALLPEQVGPLCAPVWPTRPATAAELIGQPLLHTASRPQAWGEWARSLALDPTRFGGGRSFDHLPLMLEAAAAGLGIAIAPSLLVERELAQGRLIAPLGFHPGEDCFTLCLAAPRSNEPALAALRAWLCTQAQS